MFSKKRTAIFFVIIVFLHGCSHIDGAGNSASTNPVARNVYVVNEYQERIENLKQFLLRLDNSVDTKEAALLAREALFYSFDLADHYQLTRPPTFHNILVNIGIRDRGLCIHWTEDLLKHLAALKLQTVQFYWGVANKDRIFYIEHSSVIVTAIGRPFDEGLVLDPWRNSGKLYWEQVKDDRYPWKRWIHFNARKIHKSYRHP